MKRFTVNRQSTVISTDMTADRRFTVIPSRAYVIRVTVVGDGKDGSNMQPLWARENLARNLSESVYMPSLAYVSR